MNTPAKKKESNMLILQISKNQDLDIIIRQKTPLTPRNINTRIKQKSHALKLFDDYSCCVTLIQDYR